MRDTTFCHTFHKAASNGISDVALNFCRFFVSFFLLEPLVMSHRFLNTIWSFIQRGQVQFQYCPFYEIIKLDKFSVAQLSTRVSIELCNC